MYKSDGDAPNFDAVSLVGVEATIPPIAGEPVLRARFCYANSETGATYGFLDLTHDPTKGITMLPEEVLEAWQKFQSEMEKFQGSIVFGKGQLLATDTPKTEDNATTDKGLYIGIGGGF